jgi:hypothetical protein
MKTFAPEQKKLFSTGKKAASTFKPRKYTFSDLNEPLVQVKLVVSRTDDEYEQEADCVADKNDESILYQLAGKN